MKEFLKKSASALSIELTDEMLEKFHYISDYEGLGALLALALDSAFTALERSQLPQVRRA